MDNREILLSMVNDYSQLEDVAAIVLGGSSTAKIADNHSDYDIYIYGEQEPPVDERRRIAQKYADYMEIDNHNFETGDVYILRETSKPVDIMYRTLSSIEANIKWVWEECNASLGYTTCFVDNVNKSEILFDRTGWFKALQQRTCTPYPEKLALNIIKKNFAYLKDAMFSFYDQLFSAVKRQDYVSINHRTAAFLASYFDVIFALNRVMHPGEKQLVRLALCHCNLLPEDFARDVDILAMSEAQKRLDKAADMVEKLRKII